MAVLTLAVESVPDGMAVGTLAAVNPINGVYAYMVGGRVVGVLSSVNSS